MGPADKQDKRGTNPSLESTVPGTVYLVGAGPGDPGLLTLRGQQILLSCNAIVYDRLAASVLPSELAAEVELHYVGKRSDHHYLKQEQINVLLVRLAREGKTVCRLKGGDPFVFGRGAEEADTLQQAGIPFEVVPGVTAGIAAAAYAGIPVTHRGQAVRLSLVTAHEDPNKPNSQVDWKCFGSDPYGTVAAYMPVANLPAVAGEMIAGGLDPQTPAAMIERGTLPGQRTVAAPLCDLAAKVIETGIRPPAVFIVGNTVAFHERLAWFKERVLSGRRIIVTRPADQARQFITALRELGIDPLICPTIETVPASETELVPLADQLDGYDWVFFTSENGVRYFFTMLQALGKDVRALGNAKIAVVGSGTDLRLQSYHLRADFVPSAFRSEVLLREFRENEVLSGLRILRVRGDRASKTLEEGLRQAGAEVDTVLAYHIRPAQVRPDVLDAITGDGADAISFTSGSSVESFETLIPEHGLHAEVPAYCIGPITAAVAEKAGWREVVTAPVSTVVGLVDALREGLGG
jgi:uroporphyrinogen III methyltransferase/synthase